MPVQLSRLLSQLALHMLVGWHAMERRLSHLEGVAPSFVELGRLSLLLSPQRVESFHLLRHILVCVLVADWFVGVPQAGSSWMQRWASAPHSTLVLHHQIVVARRRCSEAAPVLESDVHVYCPGS